MMIADEGSPLVKLKYKFISKEAVGNLENERLRHVPVIITSEDTHVRHAQQKRVLDRKAQDAFICFYLYMPCNAKTGVHQEQEKMHLRFRSE